MKHWSLCLLAFFSVVMVHAQSAVGTWKAVDDESGEVKSHISISEEEGKLVGAVVKLINPESEICTTCKGDKKDQPLIGMEILWDLEADGDGKWSGGHIMDPKSGNTYKCKIKLKNPNELEVRGFLGFTFMGRTQTWYRLSE